jgi:hypothetical protein
MTGVAEEPGVFSCEIKGYTQGPRQADFAERDRKPRAARERLRPCRAA